MRKIFVFLGISFCCVARAGNIDCVKFLRAGDQKICMKTQKETLPSVAVRVDDTVYYASTTSENRRGIRLEYNGAQYSLYNYDDTEYELIHWLSGEDALVDGIWRDKVAIGGALDFTNHGCTWNDEHTGYYSADGWSQYFVTSGTPTLDFGTDWYMVVVANVGVPIGTLCPIVDLGSLAYTDCGIFIGLNNKTIPGFISTNAKKNSIGGVAATDGGIYRWGEKAVFIVGANQYSINQSRAFLTFDGNRYYGVPYNTSGWNCWKNSFYLFRGVSMQWVDGVGFENIYQCGPSTIYDIKIWRKK